MELTRTATKTKRGAAIALALAAALVAGSPAQQALAGGSSAAKQLASLTNQARKDNGLGSMKLDKKIAKYAKKHSKEMAKKGSLFHTSDLGGALKGANWKIAGENVGVGPSADDLQAAFMNSAPHKKNILNKSFDHFAVGAVEMDGQVWVTVIFYG